MGSGHKFQSNCGMQFQSSAVFKVLTCFSDLSHVCDTWRPVTTRPIVRLVGMWISIWSSYMQPGIINIFMDWPLPLCNLLVLSDSLGTFPTLHTECWGFSFPTLSCTSMTVPTLGPGGGRTERGKKTMRIHPLSLVGPQFTD